jgi:hypothetical protein
MLLKSADNNLSIKTTLFTQRIKVISHRRPFSMVYNCTFVKKKRMNRLCVYTYLNKKKKKTLVLIFFSLALFTLSTTWVLKNTFIIYYSCTGRVCEERAYDPRDSYPFSTGVTRDDPVAGHKRFRHESTSWPWCTMVTTNIKTLQVLKSTIK